VHPAITLNFLTFPHVNDRRQGRFSSVGTEKTSLFPALAGIVPAPCSDVSVVVRCKMHLSLTPSFSAPFSE
jgi:hypothetical protein